MSERAYRIRTMTRADLDLAVEWAAAEGWNPGRHDADAFFAADPTGFLVGTLDDEPIASISVVKYGRSFAFLGFYIVKPEYRGQGYGLKLWKAGLDDLAGRTVGLDGVVAQQDNYRKSGFVWAHANVRYEGAGTGRPASDPDVIPLERARLAEITAYDRPFFGDDRASFLAAWTRLPESQGVGFASGGRLEGYGIVRPCRAGFRIGPLFANSPDIAERLFSALAGRIPAGAPLFLDVPTNNAAAVALVERHAMTPAFETARMYKGPAPELPTARWYGVTSLELG